MQDPWIGSTRPSASESRATTSAPPQTKSCVLAKKNTLALTGGFRGARPRSAARHVDAKTLVDKALNFYVKTTGRHEAQKRQELVNMRPGDRAAISGAYGKRVQRKCSASKRRRSQAWKFFRRQGGLRRRTREEFEEFDHKVMRNITCG